MHAGCFLFSELIAHLPHKEFQKCVTRYDDGSRWRKFSYWDQYLAMAFAQLTYRESLRDIEACLRAMGDKLYHLGFHGRVSRSTASDTIVQASVRDRSAERAMAFSLCPPRCER